MPLVFLIGYRGTGKTTVARLLAEKLAWAWRDADALLEERHGRDIRRIFAEEGEAGFRDKEAAILEELSKLNECIVATGGGVILRPENRALLRKGRVVWLTASPEVLWQRVQTDALTSQRRPNLAQGGLGEIEELLRQRTPWYAGCADLTVDTESRTSDQVAEAIVQWLNS